MEPTKKKENLKQNYKKKKYFINENCMNLIFRFDENEKLQLLINCIWFTEQRTFSRSKIKSGIWNCKFLAFLLLFSHWKIVIRCLDSSMVKLTSFQSSHICRSVISLYNSFSVFRIAMKLRLCAICFESMSCSMVIFSIPLTAA